MVSPAKRPDSGTRKKEMAIAAATGIWNEGTSPRTCASKGAPLKRSGRPA